MSKQFFVLGILAALMGCSKEPGDRDFERAQKERGKDNLVRARRLLEESINQRSGDVRNAQAYNQLGLVFWELKDSSEALEAFKQSRAISAERYDAAYNLGWVLSWGGQLEQAEKVLNEASLLNPQSADPFVLQGATQLAKGSAVKAAAQFNQALERDPDNAQALNSLAIAQYMQHKNAYEALGALKKALAADPQYSPTLFNMGALYFYELNDIKNARKYLQEYVQRNGEGDVLLEAELLLKRIGGDTETATAQGKPVRRSNLKFKRPSQANRSLASGHFSAAAKRYAAGDYKNAISGYRKAIEADDTYSDAFYNLALSYYAIQQYEQSLDAFLYATELNQDNVAARYGVALAYYAKGDKSRARTVLEKLRQDAPNYAPAKQLLDML